MFQKIIEVITHRTTLLFLAGLGMLLAALFAVEVLGAPPLLQVALYKGFLLFAAAHIGYWIDRRLFPYARPDQLLLKQEREAMEELHGDLSLVDDGGVVCAVDRICVYPPSFDVATLRRALIVVGTMICVAFGS